VCYVARNLAEGKNEGKPTQTTAAAAGWALEAV
jgi:hypothetical protein